MANIDQDFVEFIVKSIVGNPDDVVIDRTIDEKGVLLKLTVNQEDLGRVIGKRGSTAQSIRTLLRALGTKNDARYNLKIIDPDAPERPSSEDSRPQTDTATPTEVVEAEDATEKTLEQASAPVEETPEPAAETEDSLADKTRKELAELDDLDI
jgi:predicted RNA-binding protein YlqC (UPF0109 family)